MKARRRRQPGKASERHIDRSDPSTRRLLADIAKCDTAEDGENERLASLAKGGDDGARSRLIEINLRLVLRVARELSTDNFSAPFDDMVMEGTLGLNDAIEHFVPKKGVKFCNYAGWWIRKRILSLFWNGKLLRYPETVRNKFKKIEEEARRFMQENERRPDDMELCWLTGVDIETIELHRQFAGVTGGFTHTLDDFEIDPVSGQVYDVVTDEFGDRTSRRYGCSGVGLSVCRSYMPCIAETDPTDMIEL